MSPALAFPLVVIQNLCFKRGDRVIFDDVSLTIPKGKVTGILGPSGTGKTTLLRLIGGQATPDSGQVEIEGLNVHQLTRHELFALRKRMGMLFQAGALLTDLDVFENVAFPLREHTNLSEEMIRDLVLLKLEAVGLRGAKDLMPTQLSGGMGRRVALARSIALDPMMVMYDEPFTGQDPISLGVLVRLIRTLNYNLGITSLLVSHDVKETSTIADYLYLIAGGKIVAQGTPEEMKDSDSPWVRQFMYASAEGPVPFHYPAPPLARDLLGELI
ncbi:intermembrane phospholipid transport system, ATP binding subunit MlaF [Gammaproteobacteria bacterium]